VNANEMRGGETRMWVGGTGTGARPGWTKRSQHTRAEVESDEEQRTRRRAEIRVSELACWRAKAGRGAEIGRPEQRGSGWPRELGRRPA
jgi:hypothetical protein